MSAITPTTAERIREIRATYDADVVDALKVAAASGTPFQHESFWAMAVDVEDLLFAIDHVITVLRQAERCGGGYGFARQLLRYLGEEKS